MINIKTRSLGILAMIMLVMGGICKAQDVKELRQEVQRQKAALEEQRKVLDDQTKRLDELMLRLSIVEKAQTDGSTASNKLKSVKLINPANQSESIGLSKASHSIPTPKNPQTAQRSPSGQSQDQRDEVGDLNANAVRKGDFPGSFKIGDGDFSLGFDGFIKAAAFYDNNFEAGTINPLPQLYGLLGQDTRGGFHLDASLSRFIVDGRAPVPGGKVRGYIEFDFASSTNFKLRHAYLTYATPKGQLLAGQTWSNFMDLRSIPEAVSEPVTSGLNFVRQPQFAWSQRFGKGFNYAVAIEDPDSPDIRVTDQGVFRRTNRPDFIGNFGWGRESGHIQIAGLLRKHEIFSKDGISDTATGWGVHLGSSVKITSKDKLAFDATYGEGIARYLVGLDPSAGGYLDSLNRVRLRDNYGGFASYQRLWTDTFRTNVYGGFAHSAPGFDQATGTFKRTIFFSGNFLYRLNTYLTFGVEYMYGKKTFLGGSSLDNHRVLVGFQLF